MPRLAVTGGQTAELRGRVAAVMVAIWALRGRAAVAMVEGAPRVVSLPPVCPW